MMSFKLAYRNVKKSIRDYTIYFLTLTFAVALFYVFNSLESQQIMLDISDSQLQLLEALDQIMGIVSVFIAVIFGFLIVYANRFLIKRRKKEMGIYMTLGMEKGNLSRLLMLETIFVGIFSLLIGLALGILLSQGLALVTAKLFEAKISEFRFVFSMGAALQTIFYFSISFLLVMILNTIMIGRQKIIDLIHAEQKNEAFKAPKLWLSVIIFIISIATLTYAYMTILDNGLFVINGTFWLCIALGCVGTFGFFFSLSGFFLKAIQQNKHIYLRNLNMFVLRQINNKINTAYISMTLVCLMLFISLSTLSSGFSIADVANTNLKNLTPYDITYAIETYLDEDANTDDLFIPVEEILNLKEQNIDLSEFAKEYHQTYYYDLGITIDLADANDKNTKLSEFGLYDQVPRVITLSDYNALLKLQEQDSITLNDNEFAINSNVSSKGWPEAVEKYVKSNPSITIDDEIYTSSTKQLYNYNLETTYSTGDTLTIIVNDALVVGKRAIGTRISINFHENTSEYEKLCSTTFESLISDDILMNQAGSIWSTSKLEVQENSRSISIIFSYLAIYVGTVFLITAVAILAIAQLSEANDNVLRYRVLRNIGTDKRMINRALFMQIFIYFIVPLLLAIVHSFVGVSTANQAIEMLGSVNILSSSLITGGIIVVIYGGYFLATYQGSKSIIHKK